VGQKNEDAYPLGWVYDSKAPFKGVGTGDKTKVMLTYLPFFSQCRG
jgi:hypothetical protein